MNILLRKNPKLKTAGTRTPDYSKYESGPEPVADFTCDECGKNGISILERFYPIGHCCYCGTDNNVAVCSLCGKVFYDYDM